MGYLNILENHYMLDIPIDSEELAKIILQNTYDWAVVLDFICYLADGRQIVIKKQEVAEIIRHELGLDNE